MAKQGKTREITREIKEHSVSAVKDKVTTAGIRTKDNAVQKVEDGFKPMIDGKNGKNDGSPENYAAETVTENAQKAVETATKYGTQAVKKGVKAVKKKTDGKKAKQTATDENAENSSSQSEVNGQTETPDKTEKESGSSSAKKEKNKPKKDSPEKPQAEIETDKIPSGEKTNPEKADTKQIGNRSVKPATEKPKTVERSEFKPRQREKSVVKSRGKQDIKTVSASEKKIKTVSDNAHRIKETKNSIGNTGKTIKTADSAFKKAEQTAKAAEKTAEATAKAAKNAEKSVKEIAKTTVKTFKAVSKAIVEGTKAAVAAGKDVAAAAVAGGPVVIVIVLVCLIAAVGGTCFGIFLSNDKSTGSQMPMSQAVSQLTGEYYNSLTAMKLQQESDTVEISGDTSINWKDVLAVYAVKYTNSSDGFDVATLDNDKLEKLKKIMKEMNPIAGVVTPKVESVVSVETDIDGNQSRKVDYVTKNVLVVSAVHISANTQAEKEKFSKEQRKQLKELLSDDYDALWSDLIGSAGEILTPGGSFVGTDIFAWPLSVSGTVTSRFGTRADPITGVVKTHGGTDIAAPTGTPILAAADGTVVTAAYDADGYGFYVKIQHNATYATLYGHCSALNVKAGQTVKQGQKIAEVGSTGHSTGPHCHFEVIQKGVRIDAMRFYN